MKNSSAFSEYFDSSPVGVVVTDRSGIIEYANGPFTELTGYPTAELVGQHVSLFARPTETQRTLMWSAVEDGSGWLDDVQGEHKDGSPFFARLAISPMAEGDNTTFRLLCLLAARRPQTTAEAATLSAAAVAQNYSSLSEREREVLRHIAGGLANGEIAERLGVSVRTVNHHVSAILGKLNVPNRTSAVLVAERLRVAQSLHLMDEEEVAR